MTAAWVDVHGDVWREGDDGLLHTPETRPFPREHVEKKWGPLRPLADRAELLAAIPAASAALDKARRDLDDAVARARADGASWDEVGASFDPPVSRQAAWERFRRVRVG